MNITNSIHLSSFVENSFLSNAFSSSLSRKIAIVAAATFALYLCFCTCRYFYYNWKKVEDGPGKVVSFFGNISEGEFKGGQLNGKGRIESFFEVQEGDFKDGKLNGQGTMYSKNKYPTVKSMGEFKDGDLDGEGTFILDAGFLKIETTADFKKGEEGGKIKMISSMKESIFFGPSVVFSVFEGEVKDDEFHGKKTLQDGQVEEGIFNKSSQGELHGRGKRTYADGRIEEGNFMNGKFIG